VEITQVLSKEDKVQHVILTSDDDEETEMEKDLSSIDNNVNNLGVPQNVRSSAPPPSSLQVIHYSPELGICFHISIVLMPNIQFYLIIWLIT